MSFRNYIWTLYPDSASWAETPDDRAHAITQAAVLVFDYGVAGLGHYSDGKGGYPDVNGKYKLKSSEVDDNTPSGPWFAQAGNGPHAESILLGKLDNYIARYKAKNGNTAPRSICLYSYMSPCLSCASQLALAKGKSNNKIFTYDKLYVWRSGGEDDPKYNGDTGWYKTDAAAKIVLKSLRDDGWLGAGGVFDLELGWGAEEDAILKSKQATITKYEKAYLWANVDSGGVVMFKEENCMTLQTKNILFGKAQGRSKAIGKKVSYEEVKKLPGNDGKNQYFAENVAIVLDK